MKSRQILISAGFLRYIVVNQPTTAMKIHIDIPDSLIAKYFGNAGHGAKSRAYDLIYEGLTEAFHTEIINIQYSQSMTNDEKRAAINQVTKDRDFLKEVQLAHISVDF